MSPQAKEWVRREDRELERRVVNFLATRYRSALRRLEVSVRHGAVTVQGETPSFHDKQIAIHCCRRVAGVRRLIDAVKVAPAA